MVVKVWHCRTLAFRPITLPEMNINHNRKIQRQISTLVVGLFATDLCILDLPRQEVKGGPVECHQTISFSYEVVELIPTAFTLAGAKYLGQKALSRRIIAVFLEYYLSF